MGHIYCLFNTKNGKRYIGQTSKDVQKRIDAHIKGYDDFLIQRALKKYGVKNFSLQTWEVPDEQLDVAEISIIKQLQTKRPNGYNLTIGGDGVKGYKFSEKHKKKISEALKGRVAWNYGKPFSDEARKKMSKAHKGKYSNFTGMKHSIEAKSKISKANKGSNSGMSKSIILIHPNGTEEKFDCIMDAVRKYNLNSGHLSQVALQKRNKYKGFKAKYFSSGGINNG